MSESAALVCGFWDEASGLAGLGWRLGESGGLLWREGELQVAEADIDSGGDSVAFRLDAGGASYEAELTPHPAEAKLEAAGSAPPGSPVAAACGVVVRGGGDKGRAVQGHGHLTRWGRNPIEGAGVLRHLALPAAEGALLLALASGPQGAPHGAEATSAWLFDAGGELSSFREALLSTQYDEEGSQSRAGLELWSEDEEAPPMRAAGTRLGAGGGPASEVTAALLRSSADGAEGLGSYLIWRG
jgi:hypothetical protein